MDTMDGLKLQALDLMFGKGSRIGLTVHIHPDGDALGSSVALMRYLRGFRGKEVLPATCWSALTIILPGGPECWRLP